MKDLPDFRDPVGRYLRRMKRHLKGRPRLWGLHNYQDANNGTTDGTREVLRAVAVEVVKDEPQRLAHRCARRRIDGVEPAAAANRVEQSRARTEIQAQDRLARLQRCDRANLKG